MFEDVEARRRRKNRIFFARDSACLQGLSGALEAANRREVVLWAFACAEAALESLRLKQPCLLQPQNALAVCRAWARGDVRMPAARRAILDCHAACREWTDMESIALCHAIGQGLSAIHTPRHAIGLPIYELTAIVYRTGDGYELPVLERIAGYLEALDRVRGTDGQYPWVDFLRNAP